MKNINQAWETWKKIAEKIGNFQATIIFSLLYFIIFTPVGIILYFFKDFLNIRGEAKWLKSEDNVSTLEKMKEQ